MPGPSSTVDQNILPVQAYFNLDGSFNTFIGQGQPFIVSATESIGIINTSVNGTFYPVFSPVNTGQVTSLDVTSANYTFNPGTGTLSAPFFSGVLNGTASAATNLAGGIASQIPYQTASGATAFIPNGTTGQALLSNGTSAPSWGTVSASISITDQTSSSSTFYPLFSPTTSGSSSTFDTSSTKLKYIPSTGTLISTVFSGSGASLTNIPNGALTNSSITIGSTAVNLGGTATIIAGLSSVTSTTFIGALTGNASTATTATTATNATNVAVTDNTSSGATWYPTILSTTTGNLPITTSSTKLSFVPSTGTLTSIIFNGALTGNSTSATNIANGLLNQIPYQTGAGATSFISAPTTASTYLEWNGSAFVWAAISGGGTVTSVSGTGSVNGITLTGTVTSSGSLTLGGTLSGIGNSQLTNSTISGVSLGSNLFSLTIGTGLSGTSYNGSSAVTIANTGILSITGTANQITSSTTSGATTLSLPTTVTTGAYIGNQTITGSLSAGAFSYGTLSYSDVDIFASYTLSVNSYAQTILQNTNSGIAASADFIISNNNGTASTYYGDLGITSSTYNTPGQNIVNTPNTVYLQSVTTPLAIGTLNSYPLSFYANSTLAAQISSAGVTTFNFATQETENTLSSGTINLQLANYFQYTVSGAITFTPSNVAASGTTNTFILKLINGGSSTITWWSNLRWASGTPPTLTVSGTDILGFFTFDNGSNWYGLVLGKAMA